MITSNHKKSILKQKQKCRIKQGTSSKALTFIAKLNQLKAQRMVFALYQGYNLVPFLGLFSCMSLFFLFMSSRSSSSFPESPMCISFSSSGSTQVQKQAMMEKMMQTTNSRQANSRNSIHWNNKCTLNAGQCMTCTRWRKIQFIVEVCCTLEGKLKCLSK